MITTQYSLSLKTKLYRLVYRFCWIALARWLPRTIGCGWKRFLLRIFGAQISNSAIIYSSAKIYDPRQLIMIGKSVIGPNADIYNVDYVILEDGAIVSQDSYLCTASHDITSYERPLIFAPILLKENSWVAARAIVGKGVVIGRNAIVGMGSVVVKDVADNVIVAGNPAKFIKYREFSNKNTQ